VRYQPFPVPANAEHGATVIISEGPTFIRPRALPAVRDREYIRRDFNKLDFFTGTRRKGVCGRANDPKNRSPIHHLPVGAHVLVFGRHKGVHGGGIFFEPGRDPDIVKPFDFFCHLALDDLAVCFLSRVPGLPNVSDKLHNANR